MASKSKSSSKNKANRPFAAKVLAEAKAIAERYQVILWHEDGEWHGRGLEMPYVFGGGKTPGEAVDDTIAALIATVATLIEEGDKPPKPAAERQRTESINIRLTIEEKMQIENDSNEHGFTGVSDYIRATMLAARTR